MFIRGLWLMVVWDCVVGCGVGNEWLVVVLGLSG